MLRDEEGYFRLDMELPTQNENCREQDEVFILSATGIREELKLFLAF